MKSLCHKAEVKDMGPYFICTECLLLVQKVSMKLSMTEEHIQMCREKYPGAVCVGGQWIGQPNPFTLPSLDEAIIKAALGEPVARIKDTAPASVASTLTERGRTHGDFDKNSRFSQQVKELLRSQPNWDKLAFDQKEALDYITMKMTRILSGDPDFIDGWRDIAGYATLVMERMRKTDGCRDVRTVKQHVASGELKDV